MEKVSSLYKRAEVLTDQSDNSLQSTDPSQVSSAVANKKEALPIFQDKSGDEISADVSLTQCSASNKSNIAHSSTSESEAGAISKKKAVRQEKSVQFLTQVCSIMVGSIAPIKNDILTHNGALA